MLSFLFLRYLSDNYETAAKKELGNEYPAPNGHTTPLQRWYEENSGDVSAFEDLLRRKVHYVIKPDYLWGNKHGYNLNISRYISTAKPETEINLDDVNATLKTLEGKIKLAKDKHNEFLKELGLPILP